MIKLAAYMIGFDVIAGALIFSTLSYFGQRPPLENPFHYYLGSIPFMFLASLMTAYAPFVICVGFVIYINRRYFSVASNVPVLILVSISCAYILIGLAWSGMNPLATKVAICTFAANLVFLFVYYFVRKLNMQ